MEPTMLVDFAAHREGMALSGRCHHGQWTLTLQRLPAGPVTVVGEPGEPLDAVCLRLARLAGLPSTAQEAA
jgi:hypothetical protein